jgi:hypothetical protein
MENRFPGGGDLENGEESCENVYPVPVLITSILCNDL